MRISESLRALQGHDRGNGQPLDVRAPSRACPWCSGRPSWICPGKIQVCLLVTPSLPSSVYLVCAARGLRVGSERRVAVMGGATIGPLFQQFFWRREAREEIFVGVYLPLKR